MVGQVRYFREGQPLFAVVTDDGIWQSPDAQLTETLNNIWPVCQQSQPWRGRYGASQLAEAARFLGGIVEMSDDDDDEDEPGTVY